MGDLITAVNIGGGTYTAVESGINYVADPGPSTGTITYRNRSGDPIGGTQDDSLYQTYGFGDFSYAIAVPQAGNYVVQLELIEPFWQAAGSRLFDVALEGSVPTGFNDIDIYALAGGQFQALTLTETVSVTDGTLDVDFNTLVDNSLVSAFAVSREAGPPVFASDDAATTEVGTPIVIDVLANDDANKDTATLGIVSGPADGTIKIVGNEILYTPSSGFTGTATFTYSFIDGSASGEATATVDILPPAAATSNSAEQIHLAWIDDAATTLTVAWRLAAGVSATEVQYRAVGETNWTGDQSILRPSGTKGGELYEATLRGLSPDTEYEFRVRLDNGSWSQIYDASTAPGREHGDFDVVFFSDTGLIGRLDGLATGTAQVRDEITALDPTLLLGGGDYAYFNTDTRFGDLEATIDAWFDQWALPLSQAPFMTTYGNHEVYHGEGFDNWHDRFPQPDESGLQGGRFYSFDVADAHFVSILLPLESDTLTQAQLDWIEADILAAQADGAEWVIPFMHASPYSDGSNHPNALAARDQLAPLFESLDIDLVLTTHDQSYERTLPLINGSSVVSPSTNVATTNDLKTYFTASDGVIWMKVSPGGKISNLSGDFSPWMTEPAPAYTAVRDNTLHHFAHLSFDDIGTLSVEVLGVVGDGSDPVLVDTFQFIQGVRGGSPGNNPPAITSNGGGNTAAVSVAENTTAVTTVVATDPNDGQTLSYSIVGGADASKFTINASSGALAFVTAPNFEAPTDAGVNNVYDVTVQVSDGNGGSDAQAIAVTVTNQNESAVGRYWIADAGTDQKIVEIHNGSTIDDALFAGKSITIVGEGPGESFKFNFDNGTVTRTENTAPYALMGDQNGDLFGGLTLSPASHTLVTEIYSADNGAGTKLGQDTLDFSIFTAGSQPPSADVSVTQTGGSTAVIEGTATDTVLVALTSQPTANVTVTVNGNTDVSASPTTLTFASANWNTAQTVTVTAVDDTLVEGPESANITFASSSSDARYNGLSIAPVPVAITDNDQSAVGRYWIADAGTDQKIVEIHNGSTIDDALFAGKSITIVGEGPGESFKFNFDNGTVTRTENTAPYALMGDQNGDLFGGLTLSPASHTLVTEIYSADNGAGTKLGQDMVDFFIV
jgi:Malectin domain/Purple acid Phosphatase, N-terminal domain/Bacterial Ig domain/Calcineurin-like phosphoesterase/Cadherin domain